METEQGHNPENDTDKPTHETVTTEATRKNVLGKFTSLKIKNPRTAIALGTAVVMGVPIGVAIHEGQTSEEREKTGKYLILEQPITEQGEVKRAYADLKKTINTYANSGLGDMDTQQLPDHFLANAIVQNGEKIGEKLQFWMDKTNFAPNPDIEIKYTNTSKGQILDMEYYINDTYQLTNKRNNPLTQQQQRQYGERFFGESSQWETSGEHLRLFVENGKDRKDVIIGKTGKVLATVSNTDSITINSNDFPQIKTDTAKTVYAGQLGEQAIKASFINYDTKISLDKTKGYIDEIKQLIPTVTNEQGRKDITNILDSTIYNTILYIDNSNDPHKDKTFSTLRENMTDKAKVDSIMAYSAKQALDHTTAQGFIDMIVNPELREKTQRSLTQPGRNVFDYASPIRYVFEDAGDNEIQVIYDTMHNNYREAILKK